MLEYRVYILNDDGKIKSGKDLTCKDDEQAKKVAKQMVDGHAIELWQAARKIAHFAPEK